MRLKWETTYHIDLDVRNRKIRYWKQWTFGALHWPRSLEDAISDWLLNCLDSEVKNQAQREMNVIRREYGLELVDESTRTYDDEIYLLMTETPQRYDKTGNNYHGHKKKPTRGY